MIPNSEPATRRELLAKSTLGIGGVALAWLLNQEKLLAVPATVKLKPQSYDLLPKQPRQRDTADAERATTKNLSASQ